MYAEYEYGLDLLEIIREEQSAANCDDAVEIDDAILAYAQDYCDGCPLRGGSQCPPDCQGLDMVEHMEPCPF